MKLYNELIAERKSQRAEEKPVEKKTCTYCSVSFDQWKKEDNTKEKRRQHKKNCKKKFTKGISIFTKGLSIFQYNIHHLPKVYQYFNITNLFLFLGLSE